MNRVEEILTRITGQHWKIRCELREQSDDTMPIQRPADAAPLKEQASVPLIDKAQSALNARLLKIDDGFGAMQPESAASADESEWQDQDEV